MNYKIVLIFLSFLISLFITGCGKIYSNIDEYEYYKSQVEGASIFMPTIDDLPIYQYAKVYYYDELGQSINLIITYSEEDYSTSKEIILQSYTFLQEPISVYNPNNGKFLFYKIPEVEVEYNGFTIYVVDNNEFEYPDQFGMIGFSDNKNQVIFMFFCDDSLNEIGGNYTMEEFIRDSFIFPND